MSRRAAVSALSLLLLASGASSDPSPTWFAGISGKLRAVIAGIEDAALLAKLNVAPPVPGVHPVPGVAPGEFSVVVMTPFTAKLNGKIGNYEIGSWPNETGGRRHEAALAAGYALPTGFVEVDRATAHLRLSEHFELGDFLTHGQADVWPKYLVLDMRLVDKLELVMKELAEEGHPVKHLHVMSGFRTPEYNDPGVAPGGRSQISRHMYGDAADVFPDDDGDGWTDDLNHDGRVDIHDARVLAHAAEEVEHKYPQLVGGIGIYQATTAHGPFVHIDVRGRKARW
jgi:hypothetical protein